MEIHPPKVTPGEDKYSLISPFRYFRHDDSANSAFLPSLNITIKGDGTPLRSYLYGADLAIWLWTLLIRGKPGESYNVGSDQAISIVDLARLMIATLDPQLDLHVLGKPIPGHPPESYVPEINLAREAIGLDVWINPVESILRTYQWHQS